MDEYDVYAKLSNIGTDIYNSEHKFTIYEKMIKSHKYINYEVINDNDDIINDIMGNEHILDILCENIKLIYKINEQLYRKLVIKMASASKMFGVDRDVIRSDADILYALMCNKKVHDSDIGILCNDMCISLLTKMFKDCKYYSNIAEKCMSGSGKHVIICHFMNVSEYKDNIVDVCVKTMVNLSDFNDRVFAYIVRTKTFNKCDQCKELLHAKIGSSSFFDIISDVECTDVITLLCGDITHDNYSNAIWKCIRQNIFNDAFFEEQIGRASCRERV